MMSMQRQRVVASLARDTRTAADHRLRDPLFALRSHNNPNDSVLWVSQLLPSSLVGDTPNNQGVPSHKRSSHSLDGSVH